MMQGSGDYNCPPLTHPGDHGSDASNFDGTRKDNEGIVEVGEEAKEEVVLDLESEMDEVDEDFFMEDVINEVKDETEYGPGGGGRNVPMSLAKYQGKSQVDENVFGGDLLSQIGSQMQTAPFSQDIQEMNDDGAEEWHVVGGSKDSNKPRCDDSMSYESKQESDDRFTFDSDDEKEDIKSKFREVTSSIVKTFDLDLLRDSIQKGEDSLRDIDGKDVILIVGKTGTGKSTLIQGIAGKRFTKKSIPCGGVVSKDVFEAKDPVCGFEIGHAKVSMTKHVKAFLRKGEMKEEAIYLDTPGFEDTDGEEIDIATSVMLEQVAKKSNTLRFIMIINFVSLLEDRGGAMRSILKFIRTFVRDFNREKRSFMFLFTHADEIKGVPESLEGAKQSLLEETIRIINGTKDEGVLELLSFIRKSLEKGYPFVNVLHPLKTNYRWLVDFMENSLTPTKSILDGNESCRLKLSSQMRLSGAAQMLLRNLRVLLGRGSSDIKEVCEIKSTFDYFDKYIDFEDMRTSVKYCNELIADHISYLHEVVESELDNGTSSKSFFSEVNVMHLEGALTQLHAIDLSFDNEIQLRRIVRRVTEFQSGLFIDTKRVSFHGLHQDLEKLKYWGSFNEDCRLLLDPVIVHTTTHVKKIKDEVNHFVFDNIQKFSKTELQQVFLNLKSLESLRDNARGISLYIEGVSNALHTADGFLSRLKLNIQAMNEQLVVLVQKLDFRDLQSVEDLATQIENIETISELLNDIGIAKNVFLLIEYNRKGIYLRVMERFTSVCSKLNDTDYGCDLEWSKGLSNLRYVATRFSVFERTRWKAIESSYDSVVDGMKCHLKAKSSEVDDKSKNAVDHGLVDGTRDGKSVATFAKYQWFDEFLPSEERFVRNCLKKTIFDYTKIFDANSEAIEHSSSAICNAENFDKVYINATVELKKSLSIITELKKFGDEVKNQELLLNRVDQLYHQFETHIISREEKWQELLDDWTSVVEDRSVNGKKVTEVTESLNFVLCEVLDITEMNCKEEIYRLSTSFRDKIIETLANFKRSVELCFDSLDYEEIVMLLIRTQALGDFSQTAKNLPKLSTLKELALERVVNDAERIKVMAESEVDFDEIDLRITEFEKAKIFDEFVDKEVSNRLSLLNRLRVDRVKPEVDVMIKKNDFGSLKKLLKPLSESNDDSKTEKLRIYVDKIDEYLGEIISNSNRSFYGPLTEEKGKLIAESIKILNEAKDCVGELLVEKTKKCSDLYRHVYSLKKKMSGKLEKILSSMKRSINQEDFMRSAKLKGRVDICVKYFAPFLTDNSRCRIERTLKDYSRLKSLIPLYMDKFFDTSFKGWKDLTNILDGLKLTTELQDRTYTDLYENSKHTLHEKIQEMIKTLNECVAETHCYDDSIVILNDLNASLKNGLKMHLPPLVEGDCNSLLREFEEVRKRQFKINIDIRTAEADFNALGNDMDKLHPNYSFWSRFKYHFSGQKTYENGKIKILNNLLFIYEQGQRALLRRDFNTLNEKFYLLNLLDNTVAKHEPLVSSKLQDLNRDTVAAFQKLCKDSQDALKSNNFRAFESLFPDYRGFVLHITALMDDRGALTSFNLVNQSVYIRITRELSVVEEKLKGFEFEIIKQKIDEIRTFGGFIADRFSLFHEQLKSVSHVQSDKWLDKLCDVITKQFQKGRDLRRLKFYAILDVSPSATKNEILQAYEAQTMSLSARKESDDVKFKSVQLKEAMSAFENDEENHNVRLSKPFDDQIRGLGNTLRKATRKALDEQCYDLVEEIIFSLKGIEIIEYLVTPKLDIEKIEEDIVCLVKDHVQEIRIEMDTNWSQRKYQDLNLNIKDLMTMEQKFKSCSHIFPSSWTTGIVKSVEKEIERLGTEANTLLESKTTANRNRDAFRRFFMRMGAVLIELPEFRDYTKKVMSDILESCLDLPDGYGLVFDLGLSLQKGGDTCDDDEIRIAQHLLTEFGHFKEVLTMVWNEETIQKAPEDIVKDIRGDVLDEKTSDAVPLDVDCVELLERFFDFESEYKSLLGEYLSPQADLNALVRRTLGIIDEMEPMSCDYSFGYETKLKLPKIMSGIFALFTILKSGASYNRVEDVSDGELKSKLLLKPHNIQIMTLLCMFGCGTSNSSSLRSQMMQIRTGEGKSIILGAAAAIFGLLGFQVRCICYSEYLSNRDYELFHDVFKHFGVLNLINYSMITTLSEEATASKGNIRELTLSLMSGNESTDQDTTNPSDTMISTNGEAGVINIKKNCSSSTTDSELSSKRANKRKSEEIMLVDEVDVFFGPEFYGQTYNQVAQLREPEIAVILQRIWEAHKRRRRRLRLADIKASTDYISLNLKLPGYGFILDNEIALMLDQVRRVDDVPSYHLDQDSDKIGYKIQDTISYKVTFGYRTVFAYLKEADNGNLKDPDATLSKVLTMPISCGQFSYANISPNRILGVSGTLDVMSDYEKNVLQEYGVGQYLYVPSVYGDSNFSFDRAGDGVSIEKGVSNFFYKITDEIFKVVTKLKRAVIVFFDDCERLNEYISSDIYRKLGRNKEILTENKNANEKAFVISKAGTVGRITICTAVFGRGTDFFSKDETLENNGGVHVIQAFLSSDMSEEIQIRGRTARQGKQGSYKLILLDEDLEDNFNIQRGSFDNWPRDEIYSRLCEARKSSLECAYHSAEIRLIESKAKDDATHKYFDALLNSNCDEAKKLLKGLYCDMKKKHIDKMSLDLAFAIDVTGSMAPYGNAIASTIQNLLAGPDSILVKLTSRFPETKFKLRVAVLGYRDIDDCNGQFEEKILSGNTHFGENVEDAIIFITDLTASTSGGSDLAEDHLGAIQRCARWNSTGDWEATIKAVLLFTDAPAHGYALSDTSIQNIDNYNVRHPLGLTMDSVVEEVLEKDLDLFMCSFDPVATEKFEEELSEIWYDHPSNVEGREVTFVPLVPKSTVQSATSGMMSNFRRHNIFVLDESSSMEHDWAAVVSVYNKYMDNRRQGQHHLDLVSIVQFDGNARIACQSQSIANAPQNLDRLGYGTAFSPAANVACDLARRTPPSHRTVIIFMSDGEAEDSHSAANSFLALNQEVKNRTGDDLELHIVGFRGGTDTQQLQQIAGASANGQVHTASDIDSLCKIFVQISGGGTDVTSILEAEISRRISDAVTNRLSAEYFG